MRITSKLVDSYSGEPIEAASIVLRNRYFFPVLGAATTSNSNGEFSIQSQYLFDIGNMLEITHTGYEPVYVFPDKVYDTVLMAPSEAIASEENEVTVVRKKKPVMAERSIMPIVVTSVVALALGYLIFKPIASKP